ncbi:MAG: disulfide bond formation protein B [Candidatus Pacebacteria bacterium]|nr:disulfide bond formation protein B [Candidatus Paceibacterota bacterium]
MVGAIDILIGLGTIGIQLFAVVLFVGLFVRPSRFFDTIAAHAFAIGFVLSLTAALGTFYYSDVIGFIPCTLCWYQRLALFPQVLILLYAVVKKGGRFVRPLITLFSTIGLLFAIYHISLPLLTDPLFCDPATSLCLQQYVNIFGYISIPVMSGSLFVVLLLLSIPRKTSAPVPMVAPESAN